MNVRLFHRARFAVVVVLVCSCPPVRAAGPPVGRLSDGRIYIKNEILIGLTEDYARSISSAGGRRRAVDAAALHALDADAEEVVARHTAAEKWMKGEELPDRVRRLGLPANAPDTAVPAIARGLTVMLKEGRDAAAIVGRIRRLSQVEWAELNYLIEPSAAPNDTDWGQQWGPSRIGMVDAWDVPQAVTSLRVAIVDTGVDRMHPDLSNSIVYGRSFNTNNDGTFRYGEIAAGDALRTNLVVAGATPGTPAADRDHGTHVAGIAAAIRDNSRGIAGIARAGIMAMGCGNVVADVNTNVSPPVTNSKTLISWSANAINDAVANDATVVNCSFANSASDNALKAALTNAQNAGVVVIAAAGNNATNISLPASAAAGWLEHPWPVLVGSVQGFTVDGAVVVSRSSFANFGPELDIAAPGTGIRSTVPGAGYGSMDGTSMAAPHVAGAVAFTRSMNPDRIRGAGTMDLLYRMVEDVGAAGPDSDFGRGLLRLRPEYLRVLKNATTFAGQGAWLLFLGQSVGGPGTYENPYPSLSEALSNTPSGGTVVLNAGATNVAGVPANTTLTNAATLTAFPDRPVTFGTP